MAHPGNRRTVLQQSIMSVRRPGGCLRLKEFSFRVLLLNMGSSVRMWSYILPMRRDTEYYSKYSSPRVFEGLYAWFLHPSSIIGI